MRNFRLIFFIISIAQISFAQKIGRNTSAIHPIDSKFCKSSFQTIYIGKENSEENIKRHLLSEIKNLQGENSSIQLQNKIESPAGFHFTYEQFYKDIKIFRSQIKVNTDKSGNIKSVFDNSVEIPKNAIVAEIFENEFYNIKIEADDYKKEFIYFPGEKKLIPALRFEAVKGDAYFEKIFNSEGKIIYRNDLSLYFSPPQNDSIVSATIFLPDPLTTAETIYGTPYKDSNNSDVSELNAERKSVSLFANFDSVANLFRLESPYIKITEHSSPNVSPATSAVPDFSFTRAQSGFEDVNVFYHISKFQSYIQSLGFNNLVNYPINADVHALNGQDQSNFVSFFNPPRLNFGEGGVDDAEDADVIIHEYGHAVSHSAAPNTNFGTERSALDEALGDYFASSYSRSINPFLWENVFSWDGHNEFWPGRMTISADHYPDDLQNNLYDDADIWSSTMMEIWEDIGRENADALQIQALYSYSANMKMSDASQLVIQADSALNNGAFYNPVCGRFYNRGLINLCETGIDESQKSGGKKSVQLINSENFYSENGNAVLHFLKSGKATVQLFDVSGKLIFRREIYSGEFSISGKNLAKGIYILNVKSGEFFENFKLVK